MKEQVIKALVSAGMKKQDIKELIEVPKNQSMGDYALPCFTFAKKLKKAPSEIAKDIALKIKSDKNFEKIEAKGPYVNFFIDKKKFAKKMIEEIRNKGDKYGSPELGKNKVMIEFSQPNTHKAFHVGHIRGTSLGESLARIMEFCGDNVVRANYSGDTGMHIAKWLWAYLKFHKGEKLKEDEEWFASIYTEAVKKLEDNEKGKKEIEEINKKIDSRKDKKIMKLWKETRKLSIKSWEEIYRELNARFDVHFFESEMEKRGKEISGKLVKMKIARISEDATIVDFKEHGFPELQVMVLLRKDGTVLYGAKDLALAEIKFNDYKIEKSVYVIGKEQDLHIHQVFKILELMKLRQAKNCRYIPVNEIRLPWGKMSSRTGDNILYSNFKKELVEYAVKEIKKRFPKLKNNEAYDRALAIAIAAMKYSMLKQDTNKNIIFDKKEAMRFEGDTGPYLLYSYARANSILKKVKLQSRFKIPEVSEYEKRLIIELKEFPSTVLNAYKNLSPNAIANYAFKLSQTFNEFYHNCKVAGSEEEPFRANLVKSFLQTLKNSLSLLGIKVIPQM